MLCFPDSVDDIAYAIFLTDHRYPPSLLVKEQSTANSNSFTIAQKTAFEAKGRLYTTGKVIQRLFITDLFT